MSYEHCSIHNKEATNGCIDCDREERHKLAMEALTLIEKLRDTRIYSSLMDLDTLQLEHFRNRLLYWSRP